MCVSVCLEISSSNGSEEIKNALPVMGVPGGKRGRGGNRGTRRVREKGAGGKGVGRGM
jgi:hypothetical protein